MAKLIQRLQDPAKSGVYRASRADAIEDALLRGSEIDVAFISLRQVEEKKALLRALGAALGFPDWFGQNWDALEDCLTDLSWREARGHVIALEGFKSLPADDLGVLIDVLVTAAGFWAEGGKPFFAVFIDPDGALMMADLYQER